MAKGAGGIEVGRASLRVVPNFDGFLTKARKGLKQAEKRLQLRVKVIPEIKDLDKHIKDIKQTINVDVDSAKARAELEAIKALANKIDRLRPDVDVDADTKKALQQLKKFNADAERILNDNSIDIDADTRKALEQIKAFDKRAEQILDNKSVRIKADDGKAQRDIAKMLAMLSMLDSYDPTITLRTNTRLVSQAVKKLADGIKNVADGQHAINFDVRKIDVGTDKVHRFQSAFDGLMKKVDRATGQVGLNLGNILTNESLKAVRDYDLAFKALMRTMSQVKGQGDLNLGTFITNDTLKAVENFNSAFNGLEKRIKAIPKKSVFDVDADTKKATRSLRKLKNEYDFLYNRIETEIDVDTKSANRVIHRAKYDFSKTIGEIDSLINVGLNDKDARKKLDGLIKKANSQADFLVNLENSSHKSVLKKIKELQKDKLINFGFDIEDAEAKRAMSQWDSYLKDFPRKLEFKVDAETRKARRDLANIKLYYDANIRELESEVDLNAAPANEKAAKLRAKLDKTFRDLKFQAGLDLNDKQARARLSMLEKQAEREMKMLIKVDQASYRTALARLKAFPREMKTKVEMYSDTKSFQRVQSILGSFVSLTARSTAGFMKLGSAVAVVGVAAGKTVPMLTALGGAFLSVAESSLKVVGSLSVPAIMSAASAYGALKSALFGFGDVWSAENWEDLNAAIEDMSWNAQQGAISLYELKKSFDFRAIQDTFWAQFDNLDRITNTLLPNLQTAIDKVAESFGLAASNLANFMTEEAGLVATKTLIEGSSVAGESLAHILGAVSRGILAVGAAATPIFNKMMSKIRNVADAWASDMVGAFQDGTLEASLRAHVANLAAFGRGVARFGGDIAGVFRGISKAAESVPANGGNTVLLWLSQLNAWVNSFEGQNALVSFFESTGRIASSVGPILASVGRLVMEHLYPAFAGFIENVAPGVRTFFEKLPVWIQPILDRMPELGEAISTVLENLDLTGIGVTVGAIFGTINDVVLPTLSLIAPYIDNIVNAIVPLSAVIFSVVKAIQVWNGVQKLLNLTIAANPIGAAVVAITALVTWLVTAYMTSEDFRNAVNTAFQAVGNFISATVSWIGDRIAEMVNAWRVAGDALHVVKDFIKEKVFQSLSDAMSAVSDWFDEKIDNMVDAFYRLADWFNRKNQEMFKMIDALILAFGAMRDKAVEKIESLRKRFVDKFNFLKNTIPVIAGAMKDFVLSRIHEMWTSGVAKVQGMVNTVSTLFGAMKAYAGDKARELLGNVTAALGGLRNAAHNKVVDMTNAFVHGFNDAIRKAGNFGRNFVTSIMNGIGNLYNSGKSVLDSFISGLTAGFDKARNAVSDGIQSVRNFFPFSPAKEGPFSGKGWVTYSGLSIGPAFAKGIEKGMKSAVSAAETLTDKTSKALDADTPTIDLDTVAYVKQLRLMESEIMRFADTFEDSMTRSSDSIVNSLRDVNLEMKKLPESPGVRYSAHMDSLEPVASSPVSQDFSIHISTMEVKNERDAKRLLEDLQKKQKIKAGI